MEAVRSIDTTESTVARCTQRAKSISVIHWKIVCFPYAQHAVWATDQYVAQGSRNVPQLRGGAVLDCQRVERAVDVLPWRGVKADRQLAHSGG